MNPQDMEAQGFLKNQDVDIISHFNGEERLGENFRVIPFQLPRRCVATYFPEANVLVPLNSFAKESQTPTSKYVPVTLMSR